VSDGAVSRQTVTGVGARTAEPQSSEPQTTRLRVLEIAQGVAGPACGRLFAAFGHDVIKCEPPGGDRWRQVDPRGDDGVGLAFVALNADKRSVVVDLASQEGRRTVDSLLAGTDVMILDLPSDSAAAIGLDAHRLLARHPRLVVVSVTGLGLGAAPLEAAGAEPEPAWPADPMADSLLAESYGGLANMIGEPGRRPLALGGEQAAYGAAFAAFLGAMLALDGLRRDGSGDVVDVAMCDVAAYIDWKSDITYAATGRTPVRTGPAAGRWRIVPAADGWVGVIYQPEQWDAVVALIDDPRLRSPELRDEGARHDAVAAWWPVVEEWARRRSAREIYAQAQRAGLAFGYSADMAALQASAQLVARQFLVPPGQQVVGVPCTGALVKSSALPWRSGAAPTLEPHRLAEWLTSAEPEPEPSISVRRAAPVSYAAARPAAEGDTRGGGIRGRGASEGCAWSGATARSTGPLAGVRVVDFGTITAGAATGRLLADYGATVIKVESTEHPDSFRQWTPDGLNRGPTDGTSVMFESNNAGKLGISLDLKTAAGRQAAAALVAGADVLIENFRVGVTERLGIDFARMAQVNPNLIYLSLSSQGQDGPEALHGSYGSTLDLLSGLASVTGYPGGQPIWSSVDVNYPDQLVSLLGAAVVVYCLNQAVGAAHLDVAQLEVVSWTLTDHLAEHARTGRVARPVGNGRPGRTPRDTYRCRGDDQWVAIACATDSQRRALAQVLATAAETGASALTAGRAGDAAWWMDHRDVVDDVITRWSSGRSKAEAVEELRRAGVPGAAVLSAAERAVEAHFVDRRVFLGDGARLKGYPLRLQGYEPDRPPAAPRLGQHTDAVLTRLPC
jgi:crotonobetainyl-CoA:carnitine CoA-transferase CaiB-like acyl-CoA transferase